MKKVTMCVAGLLTSSFLVSVSVVSAETVKKAGQVRPVKKAGIAKPTIQRTEQAKLVSPPKKTQAPVKKAGVSKVPKKKLVLKKSEKEKKKEQELIARREKEARFLLLKQQKEKKLSEEFTRVCQLISKFQEKKKTLEQIVREKSTNVIWASWKKKVSGLVDSINEQLNCFLLAEKQLSNKEEVGVDLLIRQSKSEELGRLFEEVIQEEKKIKQKIERAQRRRKEAGKEAERAREALAAQKLEEFRKEEAKKQREVEEQRKREEVERQRQLEAQRLREESEKQREKEKKARVMERAKLANWCWVVAAQYLLRHEVVMKELRQGQIPSQDEVFYSIYRPLKENLYHHQFDNFNVKRKTVMGNSEDVANAISRCLGNGSKSAIYEVLNRGEAKLRSFLGSQLSNGPIAYKCYKFPHWIVITGFEGAHVTYCDYDGKAKKCSFKGLFGDSTFAESYHFVNASAVLSNQSDYAIEFIAESSLYTRYSVE